MVPQTLMKSIKAGPSQFHCPWSVGILCAAVDLDMSGCLAWDMEDWHNTLTPTQTSAALIMTRSSFGMILAPISETPPIWVDSSVWEATLVANTHGHGSVAWLPLQNNEHQYVGCSQTTQCKRGEGDISIVVTHHLRWDLSCFHSIVRAKASVIWAGDGGGTARGTEPDSASTHTVGVTPHSKSMHLQDIKINDKLHYKEKNSCLFFLTHNPSAFLFQLTSDIIQTKIWFFNVFER